jgi:hypothetical protein
MFTPFCQSLPLEGSATNVYAWQISFDIQLQIQKRISTDIYILLQNATSILGYTIFWKC